MKKQKVSRDILFRNKITGEQYISHTTYAKKTIDGVEFAKVHPVSLGGIVSLRSQFVRADALAEIKVARKG